MHIRRSQIHVRRSQIRIRRSQMHVRRSQRTCSDTMPTAPERRRSSIGEFLGVGVYWVPPVLMGLAYLFGIAFPLGLHGHYSELDGKVVGSLLWQQVALIFGTLLAYFAQVCLAYTIRIVGVQYLWRGLKRAQITMAGIDAAWAVAANDPAAVFNKEIWRKTPLAILLVLISWLLPLTTFFAPATLNVVTVMRNSSDLTAIPALDINNPNSFQRFSYTINSTSGYKFLGPRTIVSRIGFAAATTGNMLVLPEPATNATYEQVFHGPYVKCSNSTADVRLQIDDMIQRFSSTENPKSSELVAVDYFAAIPDLSQSVTNTSIQIANLTDVDGASSASNELWIFFRQYQPSLDFSTPAEYHYLTCGLYNASYTVLFLWENGVQDINITNLTVFDPVPYPIVEANPTAESQVAKSYSAILWSLASQLTGSVAFYKDLTSPVNRIYSLIRTDVAKTVLLGSSDFNSHFQENHMLGLGYGDSGLPTVNSTDNSTDPSTEFSDQRLQDMAYVGARPLDVLIPELSKNITISLLTDSLLAPSRKISVNFSRPATIYAYQSQNIFIIYPIAISITAIIVVLGIFVFRSEKVSHDMSFSSIAGATSAIPAELYKDSEKRGERPLSSETGKREAHFHKGVGFNFPRPPTPELSDAQTA